MATSGHRKAKIAGIAVLAFVVVVVGAGAVVVGLFSDKAKPGVSVAGEDVSGKDGVDVARTVNALTSSFQIAFTSTDGKSVTAKASDLGISFDQPATIQAAISGGQGVNALALYNPWQQKSVPLAYSLDDATAQQFLDSSLLPADVEPQDASVSYDKKAKKFVVKPGVVGQAANLDDVKSAIAQATAGSRQASYTVAAVESNPLISDDAAKKAADKANKALGLKLKFTSDEGSYTVPVSSIAIWTKFTSADGALDVVYDEDAIAKDLPKALDDKIAAAPVDEKYLTANDVNIVKLQTGKNGTEVPKSAADKAVKATADALAAGKAVTQAVKTKTAKYKTVKEPVPQNYDEPNGAKWIDINLSTQTATTYKGTTKIKTYVVATGINTPDRVTDRGTWYVWLKMPVQTMRGEGYVTPNVRWISYFHGGEGFHAAPWVSNFGVPHSHGCVNMTTSQAKEIYDWAPLGTKVVVHGQTP